MNNKMKKFSKILMMTVAILLTLVLASTSVVSGIFAKYVVTKKATATVSLQKFGLTLKVEAKDGIAARSTMANGDTIAITIDNLQLTPGQTIDDAIKFTIGGTSNVANVNLKVVATVDSYSSVIVPSGIGDLKSDTSYLPIKFTTQVGTDSVKTLYDHWKSPASGSDIQTGIITNLKTAFGDNSNGNTAVKSICNSVGAAPSVKTLNFGFAWENGVTLTGYNSDEIGTYIAEDGSLSVKVTYKVSLEQA